MQVKITNFFLKNPFSTDNKEPNMMFVYSALHEFKKLKTPTTVAYNVVKSIGVVEKSVKECESTRVALCESLCEKDAEEKPIIEKNNYKFTEENKKEFHVKWQELLNTEITLDIFPINKSDIENVKEINIACFETLLKHGFIKDDTISEEK